MENQKITDLLFEDLITFDIEASNYEDVIQKISALAYKTGYVEKDFAQAVINREKVYPTALPTEILKVAIPHPMERNTIKKSAIIISRLKKPVNFILMGSDDEIVPVDIVFTLAVDGTKNQLSLLQNLVGLFSNPDAMKKISKANTPKEMISTLSNLFS